MKKSVYLIFVLIMCINIWNVDFNGNYESINRFAFTDSINILKQENIFHFLLSDKILKYNKFHFNFDIISTGPYISDNLNNLSDYNNFINIQYVFNEYYIYLMNFPFRNSDFHIGKQRIVLGNGDLISPVDFINPPDLTDSWNYDKKLGVFAIKHDFYFNDFCITNVCVPYFTPAAIPNISENNAIFNSIDISPLNIGNIDDNIINLQNNLADNIEYTFVFDFPIYDYDFNLIYSYRHDYLPWPLNVTLHPQLIPITTNIDVDLYYPRMHNMGICAYGNIFEFGVWGDFALFIPIDSILHINPTEYGEDEFDTLVFQNDYYYRFLLGFDYMFSNMSYLNIQYLHGFISEIGNENSNEYIFVSYKYTILNNKLSINPIDCGIEINALTIDSISVAYIPQITYSYYNSKLELSILKTFLSENTLLGSNKQYNGFELNFKYYF